MDRFETDSLGRDRLEVKRLEIDRNNRSVMKRDFFSFFFLESELSVLDRDEQKEAKNRGREIELRHQKERQR